MLRCLLAVAAVLLHWGLPLEAVDVPQDANVHTLFLCECGNYFQWMSLGMMWSHRKTGQSGPITRVMCCTDEQARELKQHPEYIETAPTHFAPSFTHNPHNGDDYSAYNKPLAVIDFLEKNRPKEEFLLIIDADMLLHDVFEPAEMGALEGRPVGAHFGYLKGVANQLSLNHIPFVKPREDDVRGLPSGRRADLVGGFFLIHQNDMRKIMHDWLAITEDVRFDCDAWNTTGDVYCLSRCQKCWISEMYGYVFAAAKADVWHKHDFTSMRYPGTPGMRVMPRIIHYGLLFGIDNNNYQFDKHWHYKFDAFQCPPWDSSAGAQRSEGGLFPHPPRVSDLRGTPNDLYAQLQEVLAIDTVNTLNEAFCESHLHRCPESEEMRRECERVFEIGEQVADEYDRLGRQPEYCSDLDGRCAVWATEGACENNPGFMEGFCKVSCGHCRAIRGHHLPRDSLLWQLGVAAARRGDLQPGLFLRAWLTGEASAQSEAPHSAAAAEGAPEQERARWASMPKLTQPLRGLGEGGGAAAGATANRSSSVESGMAIAQLELSQGRSRSGQKWMWWGLAALTATALSLQAVAAHRQKKPRRME